MHAPPAPTSNQSHVEIPPDVRALIEPPEDLAVHQWVENYRRLHPKDAAAPGAFSYEDIPYMVEPTDALTWAGVSSIVLIKASRCSGTEQINNHLAYSIDGRPMPCGYVLSGARHGTKEQAEPDDADDPDDRPRRELGRG